MVETLRLKLKEQKGFTLIELLAVIVILGIIAAIAIPAINNVVSKSKDKAKVAEAIQIIDAAKLALAETGTTSYAVTATSNPLSNYISKLKDNTFTVSYTASTNTWIITGHEAADTTTTEATAGTLTEDELAALAR